MVNKNIVYFLFLLISIFSCEKLDTNDLELVVVNKSSFEIPNVSIYTIDSTKQPVLVESIINTGKMTGFDLKSFSDKEKFKRFSIIKKVYFKIEYNSIESDTIFANLPTKLNLCNNSIQLNIATNKNYIEYR